jgi:lipoate-protein ligase A
MRCIVESGVAAHYGLAVDEAIMQVAKDEPVMHVYTFNPPAVIVGRHQDLEAEVNIEKCNRYGILYNRRITGGGAVLMCDGAVGLAIAVKTSNPEIPRSIGGIFKFFSKGIVDALKYLDLDASYRPKNDIETNGKKIAGLGACRDENDVLLFHASILADFDPKLMLDVLNIPPEKVKDKSLAAQDRITTIKRESHREVTIAEVVRAIIHGYENLFHLKSETGHLSESEMLVKKLMSEKYLSERWINDRKISKSKVRQASRKTPGGLLRVYVSLQDGIIQNLLITGDFFSPTHTINKIESALRWIPAKRESVEEAMSKIETDIFRIDREEIVDTLMDAINGGVNADAFGCRCCFL